MADADAGTPRMKAAQNDRYGPPEVVEIRDVERPTPSDDQLLVRVRAASVNRADLDGLKPKPGFVRLFMGIRAPRNHEVGIDAAGVVEAIGPGVTRFKPGDEVMTDLFAAGRFGAFAEYVCARERAFEPIPPGMSFEQAATLPHSAVLALQGMRLRSGRTFKPGDKVLIDGASGNVGPFAVQIAKAMSAEVTGVARGDKLEFVRSLGADHVIDYESVDYTKAGERYDWIVSVDAHYPIRAVRRALKPNGVYLTMGGETGTILAAMGGSLFMSRFGDKWSGMMLWWKPMHRPDIDTLKELIAAGKLKPVIDRRYSLDQVVEALRWVEDGHARGKVVIIP
ncbi:MAG TPA: NAD(P)-dependent alcohol dehydrogenase [Candidatus Limnocylindrales bacterium]|nr:NAD(P)-dependent alcohol dehydrogenase [Candidatus Limnocylindrales bacterium]